MAKRELNWISLDETVFNAATKAVYQDYRNKRKVAAEAKAKFEDHAAAEINANGGLLNEDGQIVLPKSGETWAFGYNFGRLSVAVAPAKEKTKSTAFKATFAKFKGKRR